MTFGTSGVTSTLGIPGTGLFYTSRVSRRSGRGGSRRRSKVFNAAHRESIEIPSKADLRELAMQEQIEATRKQIQEEEAEYEELLNKWRDLPEIPTSEEIAAALEMKEFKTELEQPPPPDLNKEKQSLIDASQCDLSSRFPYSFLPGFVVRRKAKRMADDVWSSRTAEIQSAYEKTIRTYGSRVDEAKDAWRIQETARIAKLQKLLDGDLLEMHKTAVEVILGIKFPFDTWCDVYLNDASEIFVNLDLPEIEDVIPSHRKTPLKGGGVREVRIDESSRNLDYFELVVGQTVLITAHLFAILPSIDRVVIAAYTQRLRKKRLDDIDTYVFQVEFPKVFIESFDADVEDLMPVIRQLSPIMSLDTEWGLERIERPVWVQEPQ